MVEQKIAEIKAYFQTKLIMGDYEINRLGHHSINVLIDEKYEFKVFIGNNHFNFGFDYDYKGDWHQIGMIKDDTLREKAFDKAVEKRGLVEKLLGDNRIAELEAELQTLKNK